MSTTIGKFVNPIINGFLAKLFRFLWQSQLVPTPGDSEEIRFLKEKTDDRWAYDMAVTIRAGTFRPYRNLLFLLWPYPRTFSLPELHSSHEIFNNPKLGDQLCYDDWRLQQYHPYRNRDTPLRSLYRMHVWACAGEEVSLGYEAQYFYSHPEPEWRLENVPDPQDPDPIRYAILAGLVEMLADNFNDRFEMGLPRLGEGISYMFKGKMIGEGRKVQVPQERAPEWAAKVPPVPGPLVVLRSDGQTRGARPWYDRNVLLGGAGYLEWC